MSGDYHPYIYDSLNRTIRGDFEGAYANCNDVWPTQHQLDLPHFVYVKGLVAERRRRIGRSPRVLDIGCGYGDLVHDLNDSFECSATGIEISPSAAFKGRARFGRQHPVVVGDLTRGLPFQDQAFDIVLVLGVFWFLLERVNFCLGEIDRTARPDSDIVFTLHVPPNPIGGNVISSYDDFLRVLRLRFEVLDGFTFYQPAALAARTSLSQTLDDILVRCRKSPER